METEKTNRFAVSVNYRAERESCPTLRAVVTWPSASATAEQVLMEHCSSLDGASLVGWHQSKTNREADWQKTTPTGYHTSVITAIRSSVCISRHCTLHCGQPCTAGNEQCLAWMPSQWQWRLLQVCMQSGTACQQLVFRQVMRQIINQAPWLTQAIDKLAQQCV